MNRSKTKVWILTFEYAGIAKAGGLAEVTSNQTKNLVDQFEFTVLLPAHGQIERLKKITNVQKLPIFCKGRLDPSLIELNEPINEYNISYYYLKLNGVNTILLSGENSFTGKYLDDETIYSPDTFNGKLYLFSIGIQWYIKYLIEHRREFLPEIIHMHDYHSVIPFIGIKQQLIKRGLDASSIITIHLLTWPRYNIDFYYACGIDKTPITILTEKGLKRKSFKKIYKICKGKRKKGEDDYPPTTEKIGAVISDLVSTVSNSYLISDIIPNLGQELIKFKSDFVWNGCDWDYEEIYQKVFQTFGNEMCQVLNIPNESKITKNDIKKYLLAYKIGHLNHSPVFNSKKVLDTINEISNGSVFVKNGNISSFSESGPLLIASGRMSQQKGFETIFRAIPEVIKVIPNAKFLLLLLPTVYSLNDIKKYANYVKKYKENLRIIFGKALDIFHLTYLAADVYCAQSRWEPFGITALEAMALKLPVIATKVGGFQETIVDLLNHPNNGTGILIEKDNPKEFSNALISVFKLAEISEKVKNTKKIDIDEIKEIANKIPYETLKSRVLLDGNYYIKIKENCYNRVKQNFRWNIVSKKLIDLYDRVMELHPIS